MDIAERRAADDAAALLVASVVGYGLGVPEDEILTLERGSATAAFARQVAMYLCHTGFELSLARVAAAFGRDRSTVAHACHCVEDRREEPQFDVWITALEAMLKRAPARRRNTLALAS